MYRPETREKLLITLAKPDPQNEYDIGALEMFNPWQDIVDFNGYYYSEFDRIMIACLKSLSERKNFQFLREEGLAGNFAIGLLAKAGLTDYGTSPDSSWIHHELKPLIPQIITKWEHYERVAWDDDEPTLDKEDGVRYEL